MELGYMVKMILFHLAKPRVSFINLFGKRIVFSGTSVDANHQLFESFVDANHQLFETLLTQIINASISQKCCNRVKSAKYSDNHCWRKPNVQIHC